MSSNVHVAVLGASGYTGGEMLRLLNNHPACNPVALTGERHAGMALGNIFPNFVNSGLPDLIRLEQVNWEEIEVVFCCLPHGKTHEVVKSLPDKIKIIDLSADFRFSNVTKYESVYGVKHAAKKLQEEAVYGLTEFFKNEISQAKLVACPGCYPTGAQIPLIPLFEQNLILPNNIVIDAKSGVSGAGRELKQDLLFSEINENFRAYGVGVHRHGPEIEQGLSKAYGKNVQINFTPHIVPITRGILTTIYVNLKSGQDINDIRQCLIKRFNNEPFVDVLDEGTNPSIKNVHGTNRCLIGVFQGRLQDQAVIISVIDNLIKGSAGQALQNFNLMYGFNEVTGLENESIFP